MCLFNIWSLKYFLYSSCTLALTITEQSQRVESEDGKSLDCQVHQLEENHLTHSSTGPPMDFPEWESNFYCVRSLRFGVVYYSNWVLWQMAKTILLSITLSYFSNHTDHVFSHLYFLTNVGLIITWKIFSQWHLEYCLSTLSFLSLSVSILLNQI